MLEYGVVSSHVTSHGNHAVHCADLLYLLPRQRSEAAAGMGEIHHQCKRCISPEKRCRKQQRHRKKIYAFLPFNLLYHLLRNLCHSHHSWNPLPVDHQSDYCRCRSSSNSWSRNCFYPSGYLSASDRRLFPGNRPSYRLADYHLYSSNHRTKAGIFNGESTSAGNALRHIFFLGFRKHLGLILRDGASYTLFSVQRNRGSSLAYPQ